MRDVKKAFQAFGAFAACVVALAAGHALAAGLSPAPDSTGGPRAVAACSQDTLLVGYTTAYSPLLGGYAVSNVTITDTSSTPNLTACAGATYRVTLLRTDGEALGEVTGIVPDGEISFSPATGLSAPVDAADVAGVTLTIEG